MSAANVKPLELERRSSLDDAIEDGGVWFEWPAGVVEPALPVFWGQEIESRFLAPHLEPAPYPAVGLVCRHNAILRDEAFLADDAGDFLTSAILLPAYLNGWIETGEAPKAKRSLQDLERIELSGTTALVHNSHAGVYGHWLVEGLPKLLYMRSLSVGITQFVLHSMVQPHVGKWIKHVFPEAEIVTYDPDKQYVRCEVLLTPTLACSPRYVFNPNLRPLLEQLAPRRATSRLLYLDRPWRGFLHWMQNAAEVQELAVSMGFEVFSPIKNSVADQIDAFASARVVSSDYGSALHNALFSPPETRVLCFNWVTFIQSRIAQVCGQRIGFQMGDTGAPLTNEGYRVDLDDAARAFEAALKQGE